MRRRLSPSSKSTSVISRTSLNFEVDAKLGMATAESETRPSNPTDYVCTNGFPFQQPSRSTSNETIVVSCPSKLIESCNDHQQKDMSVETPATDEETISPMKSPPLAASIPHHLCKPYRNSDNNGGDEIFSIARVRNSLSLMRRKRDLYTKGEPIASNDNVFVTMNEATMQADAAGAGQDDDNLFATRRNIVLTLGQCLLQYGCPCHRVVGFHTSKMD